MEILNFGFGGGFCVNLGIVLVEFYDFGNKY
jgi:hypothetical protein